VLYESYTLWPGTCENFEAQTKMTAKQELYLHIGTVKTGTTALQQFFHLNRQVLKNHNISYPENRDNRAAHHRLSWSLALSEGKTFSPNWPADLASPANEWNYLQRQCVGQKVLISSEHFFNRSRQSISTLKKKFSEFDVKIIVYWRRRDHLEDAWYNQLVKKVDKTFRPTFRMNLQNKKQLKLWAAAFGRKNIILRPYEKSQLYQKDVLADFMQHVFGLGLDSEFEVPENRANDRLHQVALEYKRTLNHLDLSLKQKRKIVDPLRDISNVFHQEGHKSFPVFAPPQRLEIIQKCADENAAIARDHLGREDGVLFFEPLPQPDDEWQPYNELLKQDALKINNYLSQHYPNQLDIVVQGILMSLGSGKKTRESALKLLPGISPERIDRALKKMLEMPGKQMARHRQNRANDLYTSRTWKAGMAIKHLYDCLPYRLQRPVFHVVQFFYRKIKQV